jgi:hypothetical protein
VVILQRLHKQKMAGYRINMQGSRPSHPSVAYPIPEQTIYSVPINRRGRALRAATKLGFDESSAHSNHFNSFEGLLPSKLARPPKSKSPSKDLHCPPGSLNTTCNTSFFKNLRQKKLTLMAKNNMISEINLTNFEPKKKSNYDLSRFVTTLFVGQLRHANKLFFVEIKTNLSADRSQPLAEPNTGSSGFWSLSKVCLLFTDSACLLLVCEKMLGLDRCKPSF